MSGFDLYRLQLVFPTVEHHPARDLQRETLQTTVDMFCRSQHLLHTLHTSSFWHLSCIFTFLGLIKHNMPEMSLIVFHLQYLKWLHKNLPIFDKFFLNAH